MGKRGDNSCFNIFFLCGKFGKVGKSFNYPHIVSISVRKIAGTAVLNSVICIHEVSSAGFPERIERAKTEKTIKLVFRNTFMAGESLASSVGKANRIFHMLSDLFLSDFIVEAVLNKAQFMDILSAYADKI